MQCRSVLIAIAATACAEAPDDPVASVEQDVHGGSCDWTQWGGDAAHSGAGCRDGQPLAAERAHGVIDPFVAQEVAEAGFGDDGPILVHYQVPLIDGDDVYTLRKAGSYVSCDPPGSGEPFPCGPDARDQQIWTEVASRWQHGALVEKWTFESDWKPPPLLTEAMFQPAIGKRALYVPGAGGSVWRVDRDGRRTRQIKAFGAALDPDTYVWGGIAIDRDDRVYYNVVKLDPADPLADILGAWLVRVDKHDRVAVVDYTTLNPDAPAADAPCHKTFTTTVPRPARPWPPAPQPDGSPTLPDFGPCGHQAPGLNQTPAIGDDGTIFAATRAYRASDVAGYVIALRPDLRLRWAAWLGGRLADGCGVLATSTCRDGTTPGVDPNTNLPPEGRVVDASSGSPVALPDGGVAYGAYTQYNGGRGHLFKFDRHGAFRGTFDFGWDITPGVYRHGGSYSLIMKDNDYGLGDFKVTQISSSLAPEWSFHATNTLTCERQPDGTVTCEDTGEFPTGFEWCMNAPVVDRRGVVYAASEDGNLYAMKDGAELAHFFLDRTRGASYTPAAMDGRGRIYAQNNGELFVIGR